MDDLPRAEVDDKEGEEREAHVDDRQEVARPHVMGVVVQEGRPRLTAWARWPRRAYVALHRALVDPDPELEEFAADALGTPQSVLRRHLLDQRDRFLGHLRPLGRRCGFGPILGVTNVALLMVTSATAPRTGILVAGLVHYRRRVWTAREVASMRFFSMPRIVANTLYPPATASTT